MAGKIRLKTLSVRCMEQQTDMKKKMISRAAHKLSELSEESCMELIATTKNRKLSERDFSVRNRLAEIRQRRKETEATKGKDRGREVEKGGMEL